MSKRMAVIVSCVDSPRHAKECTKWLRLNSTASLTDVILVDNGSATPLPRFDADIVIRLEENIGGNAVIPIAHQILTLPENPTRYDVVAFFHCDLFIRESAWDVRVLQAFDADPRLGLVAFVGSPEMSEIGGRGSGTRLNYLGDFYEGFGQCSTAEMHGIREEGLLPIANLDHCAMIFRNSCFQEVAPHVAYCPTHFYDRALIAECNYRDWHCAYLGILCDHSNGGTAEGVVSQEHLLRRWLDSQGLAYRSDTVQHLVDGINPAHLLPTSLERPDTVAYAESERRFLQRYREELKIVPFFVLPDYSKIYWSHNGRKWVSRTEKCEVCRWNQACERHS